MIKQEINVNCIALHVNCAVFPQFHLFIQFKWKRSQVGFSMKLFILNQFSKTDDQQRKIRGKKIYTLIFINAVPLTVLN